MIKEINLQFKFDYNDYNSPNGFILQRDLTEKECRYILEDILMIYEKYWGKHKNNIKNIVNNWLRGETGDYLIMELQEDSSESICIWSSFEIVKYLKKINAIL